jgi:hypothetical protein
MKMIKIGIAIISGVTLIIILGFMIQIVGNGLDKAEFQEMALSNPLINGIIDGEISIYIEPLPPYVSNNVKTKIEQYKNTLNLNELELPIQFKNSDDPNADISISWVKHYDHQSEDFDIFNSKIKVGLGKDNCIDDWRYFDAQTVDTILAHEIGHSLGYGHSDDPTNIMYFMIDSRFEKDFEGMITVADDRFFATPFCNDGLYAYSFTGANAQMQHGVYTYVISAESSPADFVKGIGQYYPGCSDPNDYISYSNTCTVKQGDTLLIHNVKDMLRSGSSEIDLFTIDLRQRDVPNLEYDINTLEYDEEYLQQIIKLFQ